jgi:Tfp pilus assembly protein PilN
LIRINLIPPEFAVAQAQKEQKIIFGASGSLLAMVLISFWFIKTREAAELGRKIAESEKELQRYQAIISQIEGIEANKRQLQAKRDVIRQLNRSRLIYPVLMEDFLPIIPPDVWVTSIQLAETGSQIKVTMNCNALSNYALATWLTNLQQSTHFSSIDLGGISYANTDQSSILSFSLSCLYQHQGPFPLAEYN